MDHMFWKKQNINRIVGFNAWCNASQSSRFNGYNKSQGSATYVSWTKQHSWSLQPYWLHTSSCALLCIMWLDSRSIQPWDYITEGESIAAMWLWLKKYPALRLHPAKTITENIQGAWEYCSHVASLEATYWKYHHSRHRRCEYIAAMWLDSKKYPALRLHIKTNHGTYHWNTYQSCCDLLQSCSTV